MGKIMDEPDTSMKSMEERGQGLHGVIVRGTERIATRDALKALGWKKYEHKRLKPHMNSLGWRGPKALRFPGENGTFAVMSGYWLTVHTEAPGEDAIEATITDELPRMLEDVTRRSLRKVDAVLRLPLDPMNGQLIRSQVTASLGVINAQLRADEHQLRRKSQGDALAKLLKLIDKDLPAISKAYRQHNNCGPEDKEGNDNAGKADSVLQAIAPSHEAASLEAPPTEDE